MVLLSSVKPTPVFVFLILLTSGTFITMLVFNAMAANPAISGGLFKNSISNVSAKFEIQLTPAGWTFSIWGLIYLFQAVWLVYGVTSICRWVNGAPGYVSPCILVPSFYFVVLINYVCNILWLFTWDSENLLMAFSFLTLTTITGITALLTVYGTLDSFREEMQEEGRQAEINFIYVFVFNGMGMYAAYTTLASVLNMGSVMAYSLAPALSQAMTAVVCLGIIGGLYITFVVVDLTFLERYSRFTFSPYAVFIWTLAGILSKNFDAEQTSSVAVMAMAGLGSMALIVKLVVSFWRQRQHPQAYRKLKVWATMGNEVYPSLSVD
ncbi:uncharacterized protein LOC143290189 [Babylonia areolata]|uniref:uncharacterized protein LOC143290189 n=1 Tax=Babylonia areolata TaxID=304850 RepID=UPI003FD28FCA